MTLTPGWDHVLRSARDAALDPGTWVPLLGCGVLSISDWDEEVSDWAREETPLYGSTEGALDASSDLAGFTHDAWIGSVLATPGGDDAWVWARSKAQGFAVEWSATYLTSWATSGLKSATGRERPDGADDRSFPSSAASDAFVYASLTSRNLDSIDVPDPVRTAARVGVYGLAAGTAWARVEGGKHFPTDVLAGAALGNFIGCFVHDLFLGLGEEVQLAIELDPSGERFAIGLAFSF